MPPDTADSAAGSDTAAARREGRRNVHRTILDARQRLTSSSGTKASYDLELLEAYVNSRLSGVFALPLLVVILATFGSRWAPPAATLLWAGMVIAANTGVVLIASRFKKRGPGRSNVRQWTARFVAFEAIYGLTWSTLAYFALSGANKDLVVITFATLLAGTAANAVLTRTLPIATLVNTLPATLTVSISLALIGGTLNYTLAAVAIGGEIFFIYLGRQLHTSEIISLSHQAEKDALIVELEEARNLSEEARREAEQANIAKSRFLATMSHELRTPLNAIIGFSEVLESELLGLHAVKQYKEYAGDIHASGEHLLNLINELLDLSRIEAGKYELNEEAISLEAIADDCRRMLEIRAKTKNVELKADYAKQMPKLWGDERAVRQVVLNLLSNAIKFTPQAGRVELHVGTSPDGGQFISVKDNGPGIPQEEIATVLSSFGQGSLAQKTAEQGAGLGLPIVQRIMDLHQGRFDLFSKLRFGTETIATFPRARVMGAVPPIHESRNKLEIYSEAG